MNNKNERQGENFFLGLFIYAVIIFVSNWILNILSKVVIVFAPSRSLAELKESPSFLFNVTYPFMAFVITLLYILLIFGAFYFAAYKFAYKFDSVQPKKNIYLQMIALFVVPYTRAGIAKASEYILRIFKLSDGKEVVIEENSDSISVTFDSESLAFDRNV